MNNEISQYFSKSDGSTIATDNDLKSLSTGTVVKNINSGESYKKIAVNVFDKQTSNIDLSPYALKTDLDALRDEIGKNTITITYGDGV